MSSANAKENVDFRIKGYIDMVKDALKQAMKNFKELSKAAQEIVKLAESYVKDSEYYLGLKDHITSLACISYAEGLLDSLNRLGYIKINWHKEKPKKVFIGGTFDIIHPGHISFLKEASKRGLVYAVVATDKNVERIKGRKPILNERERLELVSSIRYVYKAIIGDENDFFNPLEKIKPDIVFLGPDQFLTEDYILQEAHKRGLKISVERMARRVGNNKFSSSELVKRILERYRKAGE